MDTELGKVLTYCERLLTLQLIDPKSRENLYLHFHKTYEHKIWHSVFTFERRFRTQIPK